MSPAERPGVLVACIGNSLVADDGAGPAVFERLAAEGTAPGMRLLALATSGLTLVEQVRGERLLVVVDAVQFGAPPGTVHVRRWDEIGASGRAAVSAHGIGLAEALAVCRRLYPERAPGDCYLVGIEGACFNRLGEAMTPEVSGAIAEAASAVKRLAGRYQS